MINWDLNSRHPNRLQQFLFTCHIPYCNQCANANSNSSILLGLEGQNGGACMSSWRSDSELVAMVGGMRMSCLRGLQTRWEHLGHSAEFDFEGRRNLVNACSPIWSHSFLQNYTSAFALYCLCMGGLGAVGNNHPISV